MDAVGGIFIGLGSNLGDRAAHLKTALRELDHGDIRVLHCSSFHETDAEGGPADQGPYLNAVAEIETRLSPRDLLRRLQAIETRHGRIRRERWGPRTLDLDLLLYRTRVINEPDLVVPHPRMWQRSFVTAPLSEICPRRDAEPENCDTEVDDEGGMPVTARVEEHACVH